METDAQTIANYSNPSWVLGGWTPAMAPLILAQPAPVTAAAGASVTLSVDVAAVPAATFQWFRNGAPIAGATSATLRLESARAGDSGTYTVIVANASGTATSRAATVRVK